MKPHLRAPAAEAGYRVFYGNAPTRPWPPSVVFNFVIEDISIFDLLTETTSSYPGATFVQALRKEAAPWRIFGQRDLPEKSRCRPGPMKCTAFLRRRIS